MSSPRARVLLIDDDPDFHRVFLLGLRQAKLDTLSAFDGASGLSAARAQHPEVVVVDGVMPGLSGVEVCRSLRADPSLADLLLVFLSGQLSVSESAGLLGPLRVDLVLSKPIEPRELAGTVARLLSARKPRVSLDDLDFAAALAELQVEYLAGVPDKLAALRSALARASSEAVGVVELGRLAHRIAGTAGSYGMSRAGEIGAQLEELCKGSSARGEELDAGAVARAVALIAAMDRAFSSDASPPASPHTWADLARS